jgi:hypothetical protein
LIIILGQDVSKLPLDADGYIYMNENTLNQIKLSQLKLLTQSTLGMQGVSSKTKAELVQRLMTKLFPKSIKCKRVYSDAELSFLKRVFLDNISQHHHINTFYNDHYGWLNQVDKDFYKMVKSTYHHTWKKTFQCASLMHFVRNVWCLYEECACIHITANSTL